MQYQTGSMKRIQIVGPAAHRIINHQRDHVERLVVTFDRGRSEDFAHKSFGGRPAWVLYQDVINEILLIIQEESLRGQCRPMCPGYKGYDKAEQKRPCCESALFRSWPNKYSVRNFECF